MAAPDINSPSGVRDNALLLLLYNTGARVSEIVNLKMTDLRLNGNGQVKILGKGDRFRFPATGQDDFAPRYEPETVHTLISFWICSFKQYQPAGS